MRTGIGILPNLGTLALFLFQALDNSSAAAADAATPVRPNVLFIAVDDMNAVAAELKALRKKVHPQPVAGGKGERGARAKFSD